MGIGKQGKKLVKLGRRAGKTLGRRGKELAGAVLERAIGILETELKGAEKAQGSTAAPDRKSAPAEAKPRRTTASGDSAGARPASHRRKSTPKASPTGAKRRSAAAEGPGTEAAKTPPTPAAGGGNAPKR
jgi:hypothetical protein